MRIQKSWINGDSGRCRQYQKRKKGGERGMKEGKGNLKCKYKKCYCVLQFIDLKCALDNVSCYSDGKQGDLGGDLEIFFRNFGF